MCRWAANGVSGVSHPHPSGRWEARCGGLNSDEYHEKLVRQFSVISASDIPTLQKDRMSPEIQYSHLESLNPCDQKAAVDSDPPVRLIVAFFLFTNTHKSGGFGSQLLRKWVSSCVDEVLMALRTAADYTYLFCFFSPLSIQQENAPIMQVMTGVGRKSPFWRTCAPTPIYRRCLDDWIKDQCYGTLSKLVEIVIFFFFCIFLFC